MTGEQFRNYVVRKFKRTDKDTELYEATTDVIVDMRLRMEAEDFKEEAYIAGIETLGEYRISLPSDFGHLIGNITVIDSSDDQVIGTLNKISKQTFDERYADRLLTDYTDGVPKDFCIYSGQIHLGPTPDSVRYLYQINYTTEDEVAISDITTDVPFCDRYRNIVRQGVLAELYDGLENYEESGYWRALYENNLIKIVDNDSKNIADKQNVQYNGV